MATGKALNGKPYAGNPHVRFDEGEVASAATPRRGSLLYMKRVVSRVMFLAMALCGVVTGETISGRVSMVDLCTANEVVEAYERSSHPSVRYVMVKLDNGRRKWVKLHQLVANVEVRMRELPGLEIIGRVVTDKDGVYKFSMDEFPLICRAEVSLDIVNADMTNHYEGVTSFGGGLDSDRYIDIEMRKEIISLAGHCFYSNGVPAAGELVRVVQFPYADWPEVWRDHPPVWGVVDAEGKWRVDGLISAQLVDVVAYMCDTEVARRLGMQGGNALTTFIEVRHKTFKEPQAKIYQPMVTDYMRSAATRLMSVVEKKTGRTYVKSAPLVDFPVSTNNVIYVPDIILPVRR